MPIYEYQCLPNKHRFEVMQKFSDPPVTKCVICGAPVERLVSAPAIQFKGSGWYITDYARKSESQSDSSKESKTPSKTQEKSTDAAPATEKKGTTTPSGSGETK
jgi:putative FmdB family regulatory protein